MKVRGYDGEIFLFGEIRTYMSTYHANTSYSWASARHDNRYEVLLIRIKTIGMLESF